MSTPNEKLVATIKELIAESLKEDSILLDSPNKRRERAITEKKKQRGKRGK